MQRSPRPAGRDTPARRSAPLRAIVLVALLLGLLGGSAPPALADHEDNRGLASDNEYVSLQFLYTLTWGPPWSVDRAAVSSIAGDRDRLVLRAGEAELEAIGVVTDDAPAAHLTSILDERRTTAGDLVVLGSEEGAEAPTATLAYTGRAPGGAGETLLTEYIETRAISRSDGSGDGVLVLALRAPAADFADAFADAQANIQRDLGLFGPLFAGRPASGGAGAPPDDGAPVDATPEADEQPDIQVDDDPPRPGDEAQPEATATTNTYTSPVFGFSVTWDDQIWSLTDEVAEAGYEGIQLESSSSSVYFEAIEAFGGDAEVCLLSALDAIEERDRVSDVGEAADLPLPAAPPGVEAAVYRFTITFPEGDTLEIAEYVECRTLVPGSVVFEITFQTARSSYTELLPAFRELLPGVSLPTDGTPTASPTIAATPIPSPTSTPTPTPEPTATTEPTASPTGGTGSTGVEGRTYTSPTFGFSLSWDETWSVTSTESFGGVDRLWLTNGVSRVTVEGSSFPGDLAACVDARTEALAELSEVTGLTPLENAQGEPLRGGGRNRAWAVYDYVGQETDATMIAYVECRPLVPGESVVSIIQLVPRDQYNNQIAALTDLLRSLRR